MQASAIMRASISPVIFASVGGVVRFLRVNAAFRPFWA